MSCDDKKKYKDCEEHKDYYDDHCYEHQDYGHMPNMPYMPCPMMGQMMRPNVMYHYHYIMRPLIHQWNPQYPMPYQMMPSATMPTMMPPMMQPPMTPPIYPPSKPLTPPTMPPAGAPTTPMAPPTMPPISTPTTPMTPPTMPPTSAPTTPMTPPTMPPTAGPTMPTQPMMPIMPIIPIIPPILPPIGTPVTPTPPMMPPAPAPTMPPTMPPTAPPVATAPIATGPMPGCKWYTVQAGDSMYKIAQSNNISLDALIAANPQIQNPALIYPGQNVCIPVGSGGGGGGGNCMWYTVKKGDSMWKIAQAHNISLDELIAANPNITNPELIYPGQKVCIPRR